MFKRVILEDWHSFIPYLCFALIAGAFLVILIRTICIKKSEADRMAHLPLKEDSELRKKN